MTGLQIPPHSRRLSSLAVAALTLVAAGSFAAGLGRQVVAGGGPSPFPTAQGPAAGRPAAGSIPEATPAPDMQVVAVADPSRRRAAPKTAPTDDALPLAATADSGATLPTVDAAATAQEPAPPPPAPSEPPADPPT